MTREQILQDVLNLQNTQILLELPTGVGKTRLSLEIMKKRCTDTSKILIVVYRLVHINSWKKEMEKWNITNSVKFITYASLEKEAGLWDFVIFDECHHLSERCREMLIKGFRIRNSILLSATVKYQIKWELKKVFKNLYIYNIPIRKAIDNNILPDPRIILLPLNLNDKVMSETFKTKKISLQCTELGYYSRISRMIDNLKNASMSNSIFKNIWLHKAGERLKWLSSKKEDRVLSLLQELQRYRTITFCSSIEQSKRLGDFAVHSKNKDNQEVLDKFNEGTINHITSVNMLDENVNLVNCQIGIYANLNSSERIVKQRLGRLLRHPNPVIIIPFFKSTRDEEIVQQMLLDYNPELVTTITDINNFKF